jgi:hypothetical protein
MKKMKSNSKKREDNNVYVVNFNDETNWNKWNSIRVVIGQIFRQILTVI